MLEIENLEIVSHHIFIEDSLLKHFVRYTSSYHKRGCRTINPFQYLLPLVEAIEDQRCFWNFDDKEIVPMWQELRHTDAYRPRPSGKRDMPNANTCNVDNHIVRPWGFGSYNDAITHIPHLQKKK
jgi:hypothetical protein